MYFATFVVNMWWQSTDLMWEILPRELVIPTLAWSLGTKTSLGHPTRCANIVQKRFAFRPKLKSIRCGVRFLWYRVSLKITMIIIIFAWCIYLDGISEEERLALSWYWVCSTTHTTFRWSSSSSFHFLTWPYCRWNATGSDGWYWQ